jgi:hypothetical protein
MTHKEKRAKNRKRMQKKSIKEQQRRGNYKIKN